MSLSSRERRNPPPRRKSCAACIKAKRRCDFAIPACLRCEQRGMACHYPPGSSAQRRAGAPRSEVDTAAASPMVMDVLLGEEESLCMMGSQQQHTQHHTQQHTQQQQHQQQHHHHHQQQQPLSSFDLSPDDCDFTLDFTPTLSLGSDPGAVPATSAAYFDAKLALDFSDALQRMDRRAMELVFQPSSLAPPTSRDLDRMAKVIEARLRYSIDETRKVPSMMVAETQTPWCHPLLWTEGMPKSLRDAHAACALYMAKSRFNGPVIFRSIESQVQGLIAEPIPATANESLAHTQALILYQIIRLFDGDILARASAERHIANLETSALNLLAHVRFDSDEDAARVAACPEEVLSLLPVSQTKAFWVDWIFQESMRRTLLFSFFLIQAYRALMGHRGMVCDGRLGLVHSWTLSRTLWGACTAVEFAEAWRAGRHFVVTNGRFYWVLKEAMADDVDDFGRIWISSAMGIEETEGWFASRGGSLRASSRTIPQAR